MRGRIVASVALGIFVILIGLTLAGRFGSRVGAADVTPTLHEGDNRETTTLFLFVPGIDGTKDWPAVSAALAPEGDILLAQYKTSLWSNADPQAISEQLDQLLATQFSRKPYTKVVLIGNSMGALLVRRAFHNAERAQRPWTAAVSRIVLLAGMNRGWDISGHKPSDMTWGRLAALRIGSWFLRLTGLGGFIFSAEAGAPFVADLRLDWMKRFQNPELRPIEIVQLLGDIDDIVSDEDNKDLRSMASPSFAWLRVRGTGHANISDFTDQTTYGGLQLGSYRRDKLLLAATQDFAVIKRENEEQAFQTDNDVTHVVFVLHGIRDLGEWAAVFEHALLGRFKAKQLAGEIGSTEKVAIASIRYGYFGMGPFLLRPIRERYVKWFMDEYTETLARYPNARTVHFVGHSNGTYLLAAALQRYRSLKVDRVVLGGSIIQSDYNWSGLVRGKKVGQVLNYVAADDWVVALFPRFFEPPLMRWIFNNDIGSAGFRGFDGQTDAVTQVKYLEGGHSAFLARVSEITDFLLPESGRSFDAKPSLRPDPPWWLRWASAWANWIVVWPLLAGGVLVLGWYVTMAGSPPAWPRLVLYALLVLLILNFA